MLHLFYFFYLVPTVENAGFPRVKISLYFAPSRATFFSFRWPVDGLVDRSSSWEIIIIIIIIIFCGLSENDVYLNLGPKSTEYGVR